MGKAGRASFGIGALVAAGLLFGNFSPINQPPAAASPPPTVQPAPCHEQPDFSRKAETLIALGINAERARLLPDAPALQMDEDLSRIAETRACEMALGEMPLSHTDAQGRFLAEEMVQRIFGENGVVGENLMEMGKLVPAGERTFGPEEFARDAVKNWMESPEHRIHILDRRFNLYGIGVAKVGGEAVVTQVFRGPPPVSANAPPKAKCQPKSGGGLTFGSRYHSLTPSGTVCQ